MPGMFIAVFLWCVIVVPSLASAIGRLLKRRRLDQEIAAREFDARYAPGPGESTQPAGKG